MKPLNVYSQIINYIFQANYKGGQEFQFDREEIIAAASALDIKVPKNPGDVVYSFRYRNRLPKEILDTQPQGLNWLILGAGPARYRFRLNRLAYIYPTNGLLVRKIPDATPEIIAQYALTDEQALLAKIRYNRLIDTFLGIVAYSLQNHLRTTIDNYGQIEIDELYVGVDARGVQYIVPVQAKGGKDVLGVIQTIQDTMFCKDEARYANCIPRTVSAQFMPDNVIALFELTFDGDEVSIVRECHYQLTEAVNIRPADLQRYRLTE
ncbi:endonuclease [Acidipila rosea]|uniref:Endonuclease n=1 Tax=Acidipila rosea TaxID=768535 RepID=A0A4R1KTE7_9BACT|nr:endonuclease [Acidipila rosea]TCK68455.1 hypothetical protein C7378_3532 [Acidipila rosea]